MLIKKDEIIIIEIDTLFIYGLFRYFIISDKSFIIMCVYDNLNSFLAFNSTLPINIYHFICYAFYHFLLYIYVFHCLIAYIVHQYFKRIIIVYVFICLDKFVSVEENAPNGFIALGHPVI